MCLCAECLQGDFIDCLLEPGTMMSSGQLDDEDSSNNSSDVKHEFEGDDIPHDDHKTYELWADCVHDVVQRGSSMALYLPPTSLELFYICKVLDFGAAAEDMVDAYNHHISMGTKYIICNYLEKESEKKSRIIYQILPKTVLVSPAQVITPVVELDDQLSLSSADYQWLSDRIYIFLKNIVIKRLFHFHVLTFFSVMICIVFFSNSVIIK